MNTNEVIELFVPGRLCLLGEHSDWAGAYRTQDPSILPGCAIVTGIEQGIYAQVQKSDLFCIREFTGNNPQEYYEAPMDPSILTQQARQGGYYAYAAGVAACLCRQYPIGGASITITRSSLPLKKGLSSSAAICVLVARAFNRLYHLNLSTLDEMELAYRGELYTPSRCGRLDQACAFGVSPVCISFDGDRIDVNRLRVKENIHLVFADLNSRKDTIRILNALNRAYPTPRNAQQEALHQLLGEDNRQIIERAAQCLQNGDAQQLGQVMTCAQRLFDEKAMPLCPDELAAPVLHRVLQDETVLSLTYGGKGIGSQGDGSVQFVARDEACQQQLIDYLATLDMPAYALTLRPDMPIRKAIIPLAGYGTRMYPATRALKKEFLPVVDRDGLTKPALFVLLEELDSIGIEKIGLIINPDDRALYEQLLFAPLNPKHLSSLPAHMQQYECRLRRIACKVEFICQHEPKGFGHAVLQARSFTQGDPVLLLLGDTIYQSNSPLSCTKQVMDTFAAIGKSTVGVCPIPPQETNRYGVFSGEWQAERTITCTRIVEKPTPDHAMAHLSMETPEGRQIYGAFGIYALTDDIFERLEYAVLNNLTSARGEIELTDALAWAAKNGSMTAYVVDGRSFDLGSPQAYRDSVAQFGL